MSKKTFNHLDTPNALDLLTRDHERVLEMFAAFSQIQNDEDEDDNKHDLVSRTCAELSIHAQLEEELFYPALRDLPETQEMLDQAQVEHDLAKQLVAELEAMSPDDDMYDAKFTVLGEYVRHHIEEEQGKIFPKVKKAGLDMENLAIDILHRKETLQEEFGLPVTREAEDELPVLSAGKKKGGLTGRPGV